MAGLDVEGQKGKCRRRRCDHVAAGHLDLVDPNYSADHPPQSPTSGELGSPDRGHVDKTRIGAAWVGICFAAVLAVALIVFLAQNTGRVHVSFLWMDVQTPLAVALLVAAVAAALLMLIIGTARILQLRRTVHQQRG